jgi:glycosyltransferase involved in cell wall biosynthesis
MLYLSAEDRRTMGQNGQKFVREYFNWTLCSRELQQLYDNL